LPVVRRRASIERDGEQTAPTFAPEIGGLIQMPSSFRSHNFHHHYIRHRNFLGELTTKDEGPILDFAFTRVPRAQGVGLRSVNFGTLRLRHRDLRIRLEAPDVANLQLFLLDSSFWIVPGLYRRNGISFRSVNYPDHYIRHRNFHLFLDHKDSPNMALDATFYEEPAQGPIDPG